MDDIKLYRCMIYKVSRKYIVGRTIFTNEKFLIAKNPISERYHSGYDVSFYAKKAISNTLFKKTLLIPVNYEELIVR